MSEETERMPLDSWLIQESLKKIAEGPESLMKWASENQASIDSKFINQLRKMIEYSRKQGMEKQAEILEFLKRCFEKMFDLDALTEPVVITQENFQENLEKATFLLKQGKARASIPLLHALLLFLVHSPDVRLQTIVDANLGIAYAQAQESDKAILHLERVIPSCLTDEQREKVSANLGTVYRDRKEWDKAIEHYKNALEISQKRQDKVMEFVHLNNLVLVHLDRKELENALALQQEAHKIAEKLGDPRFLQDSFARLAVIYGIQGDIQHCRESCEKGLSVIPQKDI